MIYIYICFFFTFCLYQLLVQMLGCCVVFCFGIMCIHFLYIPQVIHGCVSFVFCLPSRFYSGTSLFPLEIVEISSFGSNFFNWSKGTSGGASKVKNFFMPPAFVPGAKLGGAEKHRRPCLDTVYIFVKPCFRPLGLLKVLKVTIYVPIG